METSYGVGVRNRFELYCDDDVEDPFEVLRQKEAEFQKAREEKHLKDKSKVPGSKKTPTASSKPPVTKASSGFDEKSRDKSFKSTKVDKKSNIQLASDRSRSNEMTNISEGSGMISEWKEEPRNKGRGGFLGTRGASRGGGRGSSIGFDQRGKREFDRQSGSNKSSVKPIEKREGAGAHNWGHVKDDMQFEDVLDMEERSTKVPHSAAGFSESTSPTKVKTEESSMTLDEWKQKEQNVRSVPSYNLRKPGEGENEGKKWGKLYKLNKKESEEVEVEEFDEDGINKRGRQKHHLDIEIRFGDQPSRGRGKGRGAGRGGRGRGAGESEALCTEQKPAPKVDDLNDFPTL